MKITHTRFVTLEVPVNFEKAPDGWYAWLRVDRFAGDFPTPEAAIEALMRKNEEQNAALKPIVAAREAEHPPEKEE